MNEVGIDFVVALIMAWIPLWFSKPKGTDQLRKKSSIVDIINLTTALRFHIQISSV